MDIQNVEFNQQLVLGCDQSFATQWLSPRIAQLRGLLPAVSLRITASDNYAESLGPEVQAAILHGDGQWPGFTANACSQKKCFRSAAPTTRI